jgi:GT2 family glycosyltransferase
VAPHASLELVERDWTSGTCLLLRRACVEAVGPFDERFGSYMEDVDYGLRANDAGWKVIVVHSAYAWGLGTASSESTKHITVNTVVLSAKRQGLAGAVRSFGLFAFWTARGFVASVAPWRDTKHRATSRRLAHQRARGLSELIWRGRLLAAVRHGR